MQKETKGAFAIIFDEQKRVLLALRDDMPLWNLPGGGIEEGETPEEACIREAKEEIGCDVQIVRHIGRYQHVKEPQDTVYVYECIIVKGIPSISNEAYAVEYFDIQRFPSNMFMTHYGRILDALNFKEPVIKQEICKVVPEIIRDLSAHEIYGFDVWLSHPAAQEKIRTGQLRYPMDHLLIPKTIEKS